MKKIVLFLLKIVGDYLFKKESLGGGDIKLLFLVGFVLGMDMSIVTIFIAAFIALPISIISLIRNDNNVLAFGPYLSLGAAIIFLTNLNLNTILNFFISSATEISVTTSLSCSSLTNALTFIK